MYVCVCHAVSDKKIKQLITEQGVTDLKGIRKCTALGSQCGKCIRQTKQLINENAPELYQQAS